MKNVVFWIVVLLLCATVGYGQTAITLGTTLSAVTWAEPPQNPAPAPPTPVQHFVMSGSVAGGPVSIATGGVQLTPGISAVYEFISNPNDSTVTRYGSGLANYTKPLSTFLPAAIKSKLLIDLTNYNLTFQAGAGVESIARVSAASRLKHVVGNFGIYGSYPMPAGHTQIGVGYKFIVGPQGASVVKVPVGTLNFTF